MTPKPIKLCVQTACWVGVLAWVIFILSACQGGEIQPANPTSLNSLTQPANRTVTTPPISRSLASATAAKPTSTIVQATLTLTATRQLTATPSGTPTITLTPLPYASGAVQVGSSVDGLPVEVYRFGNGARVRMIVAGIHGGYEWNTIQMAEELIAFLEVHPERIPAENTLYILPALNPDGEALGHIPQGRANANGVDLNRNFPTGWKVNWARTGCWQQGEITAGKAPLSEPESLALAEFLEKTPVEALISYHSAGMGIYPGGSGTHQPSIHLAQTIASASEYPYPPFETGCEPTGMLVNHAAALEIAAVDLELFTHWDTELEANLDVLAALLNWRSP